MRRVFAILLIPLVAAGTARAEEVTTFSLDNGMDVVAIEDHRAPVVVQMVWYRIGAADEPPGKTGVAHYLEHLMFEGTDERAPGKFSELVAAQGGTDNAFTSYDYTGYFQRVAADRLGLIMQLEADRMTDLTISAEAAETERGVILEERNQRVENNPGALFAEQRSAAQYLNHPYGDPIVGWRAEIQQLTRADAVDFYQTYYAPNNAVLVVAGDVAPEAVRRLAEKHYGPLPANPELADARSRPAEPPQRAERRLTFTDPRVGQPYVMRTYLAPERDPGEQQRAAALTVLARLLGGGGVNSVFGQKLQVADQVALSTGAFYDGTSLDDTTFGIYAVPTAGTSLSAAEDALDAALAEFMEAGVDPDRFARGKTQLRAATIYERDNVQALARRYGSALTTGLTVADVQAWPGVLQAVEPDDVMAAAEALFDRDRAVTGYMDRPDDAPGLPSLPTAATGPSEEMTQ